MKVQIKTKNKLYGDGIHDDLPAIQEMLDSGAKSVYLPEPKECYLISGTIFMHSYQELRLEKYTVVRLADNSNCAMIENAEPEEWNSHISITGGIWDMNHNNQKPNPWHFPDPETGLTGWQVLEQIQYDKTKRLMPPVYTGMCMRFNSIRNFHMSDITIINPVIYGIQISFVEDFTIENIVFEFHEGSPKLWNMDGVHVEGGCKNGLIRNLKGACHDDTVAITSDDSIPGPIENIVVDGIYANGSHSAVRLLSRKTPIRNVHISNIYGTFYVYCIIISKYREAPGERSCMENIMIDHVCASLCEGTVDVEGNYSPLISIGENMDIPALYISNVHRDETHCAMPTIGIGEGTCIKTLSIACSNQTNSTGQPIAFLNNNGTIEKLILNQVNAGDDELLSGPGMVGEVI